MQTKESCQDSCQQILEIPGFLSSLSRKTGKTKKMQEASRFLFGASVILKASEASQNELMNYPKIYSIKYPKNADNERKLLKSSLTIAKSALNYSKI